MGTPQKILSKKFAIIAEVMTVWAALPTDLARANTPPIEFRNISYL
jgi:hypothetical protein